MRDVTGPIRNMVNTVDRIRRGQLDSRVEGFMLGELDMLKRYQLDGNVAGGLSRRDATQYRPGDVRSA